MRKLASVCSGLALSFTAAVSPVLADTKGQLVYSADDAAKINPKKILVGTSVVLVLDASYSVDANENAQMVDGIKQALLDEEKMVYRDCLSISAVHYADWAQSSGIYIVCSRRGMEEFIAKEIDYIPGVKPQHQYGVGSYTNVSQGIYRARDLLLQERDIGVMAMKHSLVIIGDGHAQKGEYNLLPEITALAKEFGASTYAIPIEDHQGAFTGTARQYYLEQLLTPAGLTYKDAAVFGKYEQPVPAGQYLPANDFMQVRQAVSLALAGAGL